MGEENKETICLAWCDNGAVDGKFTASIVNAILLSKNFNINIVTSIRVLGNQIARQRQIVYETWKKNQTDWILWIDSDIAFDINSVKMLLDSADKENRPVVSGTYFISKEPESSIMPATVAAYKDLDEYLIKSIELEINNEVIEIDSCGMGFILMHKSIIEKLDNAYPNEFLFKENEENKEKFIGEDIAFCRKLKNAGVPIHLNTSVLVGHIKRFYLDHNYYLMYWDNIDKINKNTPPN